MESNLDGVWAMLFDAPYSLSLGMYYCTAVQLAGQMLVVRRHIDALHEPRSVVEYVPVPLPCSVLRLVPVVFVGVVGPSEEGPIRLGG